MPKDFVELTKEIGVRKIMFRPINIISNFPQLSSVTNKNEFADYDVEEIIKYIDFGIAKAKELNVDTDLIFNRKYIPETQTSYPFCKKMSIRVLHIPLYLILSRAVAWLAEEIQ